jgi:hypothetical protein
MPHRSCRGRPAQVYLYTRLELITRQIGYRLVRLRPKYLRGPQGVPYAHANLNRAQAVEQVFPESSRQHLSAQVPIGGRNQPYIHVPHFRRAHPVLRDFVSPPVKLRAPVQSIGYQQGIHHRRTVANRPTLLAHRAELMYGPRHQLFPGARRSQQYHAGIVPRHFRAKSKTSSIIGLLPTIP